MLSTLRGCRDDAGGAQEEDKKQWTKIGKQEIQIRYKEKFT